MKTAVTATFDASGGAVASRKLAQRADLIDEIVDQLFGRAVDLPAAEALEVAVSGMGADPDAVLDGEANRIVHQVGIAGMEAGGDVGRADQSHQDAVARIADRPAAEGLAEIAIDVHRLQRQRADPSSAPSRLPGLGKTLSSRQRIEKCYLPKSNIEKTEHARAGDD